MHRFSYLLTALSCVFPATLMAQEEIRFRRHVLNSDSEFSAATAIDINQDDRLDIVCGAWWYEAPHWQRRRFREVRQIRGRYDDYSNLPLDVNQDGLLDIVSVNYRSRSLYWCPNPGTSSGDSVWPQVPIDEPGPSETGRLVDLDGDGQLDVLPNGTKFAAWYEFEAMPHDSNEDADFAGAVTWRKHNLPQQLAGHGIGAGDINGDGRLDVVCPKGWAEAPLNPREGRWIWHPDFELARDCGLPILCHDVDQDGDIDLVWGRGHNIGLYWTEQISASERSISMEHSVPPEAAPDGLIDRISTSRWITHAIDTRWGSLHTLMLADIDGDGLQDVVTGRRYLGHDGKDPGENDPLCLLWYRFQQDSKTWSDHLITYGGRCGIDLDSSCVDLDQDGDLDILAPARCGLHWIENLRISPNDAKAEPLAPPTASYADRRDLSHFIAVDGTSRPMTDALEHGIRRQHILAQMQQVMGSLPGTDRRVPLQIHITSVETAERYTRIHLSYAAEPGDRVPALLLVPQQITKPAPAMLCLHPTHFELGKAQICGLGGNPDRFYAHELAESGFVCLAPDYPGFGEYAYDFSKDDYVSGTMKAIWNNIRAIDLLQSLPCVSRDQIGVIGHSLGGHNALFTAAFDQRLRCVVTSCGFTALEDYYEGDLSGWTSDRYMPWIQTRFEAEPARVPFDFPEVLAAIAPRRLLVSAPLRDGNFAVSGVRKCKDAVEPVYKLLDAADALQFVFPDTGHDFSPAERQLAQDWLHEALQ